jgi:hypothetical protein
MDILHMPPAILYAREGFSAAGQRASTRGDPTIIPFSVMVSFIDVPVTMAFGIMSG